MCFKNKNVPDKVFDNWKQLNPDYSIKFFDDDECYELIRKDFNSDYADFFREIPSGPIKADFFRLLVLYKYGGVYSDVDLEPLRPLSEIIEPDDQFISVLNCVPMDPFGKPHIFQAFIACTAEHPIIKDCIDRLYKKRHSKFDYWKWSGTRDMYQSILKAKIGKLDELELDEGINQTKSGPVKLLQEYIVGPKATMWTCYVKYKDSKRPFFKSRYNDYPQWSAKTLDDK